jgi:hypothetical protein
VEAIEFNSVKWEMVSQKRSPLHRLEKKVGGGGGGVSGRLAQDFNWKAMNEIVSKCDIPVIASSIMREYDVDMAQFCGASAVSFGTIHLRTPWKPTQIVEKLEGIK